MLVACHQSLSFGPCQIRCSQGVACRGHFLRCRVSRSLFFRVAFTFVFRGYHCAADFHWQMSAHRAAVLHLGHCYSTLVGATSFCRPFPQACPFSFQGFLSRSREAWALTSAPAWSVSSQLASRSARSPSASSGSYWCLFVQAYECWLRSNSSVLLDPAAGHQL